MNEEDIEQLDQLLETMVTRILRLEKLLNNTAIYADESSKVLVQHQNKLESLEKELSAHLIEHDLER